MDFSVFAFGKIWLTFCMQGLPENFHAGSAEKISSKVWLIGSRVLSRGWGVMKIFLLCRKDFIERE